MFFRKSIIKGSIKKFDTRISLLWTFMKFERFLEYKMALYGGNLSPCPKATPKPVS